MEQRELVARELIRQLIAEYTWCGDFGNTEGFASGFTHDGILDIKGRETLRGRAAVLDAVRNAFWLPPDMLAKRRAAGPFRHHVSNLRIAIDDERNARAWAYFFVLGARGPNHWGRYTDTLRLEEGQWRFALRRVSIDGASAESTHQPPNSTQQTGDST